MNDDTPKRYAGLRPGEPLVCQNEETAAEAGRQNGPILVRVLGSKKLAGTGLLVAERDGSLHPPVIDDGTGEERLRIIELLAKYGPFNVGEVAGFRSAEADSLIASGRGREVFRQETAEVSAT